MPTAVEELESILDAEYDQAMDLVESLRMWVSITAANREQLREYLADKQAPPPELALKFGAAHLLIDQGEQAVEALKIAPGGTNKRVLLGEAYKILGNYRAAIGEFERAIKRDWDQADGLGQIAECYRLDGQEDAAQKIVDQLGQEQPDSVHYHYQKARLLEIQGQPQQAIEQLEQAVEKQDRHTPALFRLAYLVDLHGEEQYAVELYKQCIDQNPMHLNAMINLASLYEDMTQYDDAIDLLELVLNVFPNHHRARLFLKDVYSSRTMYYDEDAQRRRDQHNQVLEIPISDFELSVRSRTCLKKMGIRTLGDLTRISEAELLMYKNFGETSLTEIKTIMDSKNLELGQAVKKQPVQISAGILLGQPESAPPADDQVPATAGARPMADLQLTARSRKCLEKLNVNTIEELLEYTEAKLLAVKNFGQTSLDEIKQRLEEMGLALKTAEPTPAAADDAVDDSDADTADSLPDEQA